MSGARIPKLHSVARGKILMKLRLPANGVSSNSLILLVSLSMVAVYNQTFFAKLFSTYPPFGDSAPHLLSLAVSLLALNALLLGVLAFGRSTKPVLMLFLLLGSFAAYFMDSYGVVISEEMLQNAAQTNSAEALDLMNAKLVGYVLMLGVLPAFVVARIPLRWQGWKIELKFRLALLAMMIAVVGVAVASFSPFYASFLREQKSLRTYANPLYFVYSSIKYTNAGLAVKGPQALSVIAEDAHIPSSDHGRELLILVIGETARADHFSINGYARETTPQLSAEKVVSFTNFHACGTSTAVSVPCMFSMGGRERFDSPTANNKENLLDVLQRAGVNVLWRDNNSDSKGVALRVPYEDFKSPEKNQNCDEECRDEGMLAGLQDFIDRHPTGDIAIVLHQMGNHGPAYFKRYPASFEKFKPVCKSNDLSSCSKEEIINAYDNAIAYTDYFLGKTIDLLKRNDSQFETAMFYLSDHGESLGEAGIYLHGLPRSIAPDSQLHVPAVMWFGKGFDDVDLPALMKKRQMPFTHDNLVHTILGFMEIQTKVYRPELDILEGSRLPE